MIFQNGRWIRPTEYETHWRRYALHLWNAPNDPTITYTVELDVTGALEYLDRLHARASRKITLTHLVAKWIGHALERYPDLNVKVVGRRLYRLPRIDLGMPALVNDGKGLYWFRIEDVPSKTLEEVAQEIAWNGEHAQVNVDQLINRFHGPFLVWAIRLLAGLRHRFGIHFSRFGITDPTSAPVVLSSAGMFARFTNTTGALPSTTGVVAMFILGAVSKKPIVIDDEIVIRPMMPVVLTTEHRVIDGFALVRYVESLEEFLADPGQLLGYPEPDLATPIRVSA